MENFDLVVVSHLRWSFVWQRPQQLLSRMAAHHRILFIEEPVFAEGDSPQGALLSEPWPNLVVMTPQLTRGECGDTPLWLWPCRDEIARQTHAVMSALEIRNPALWFYTPTPEFMLDVIKPKLLIYDVMDELANFKFAPPELRDQERRLLSKAAVVFTGGASLYDAKKHHNPNTHLFASGVDSKHYSAALRSETTEPEWMQSIPGPRAVYIGVIDERLDYELIEHAARELPHVQFLICGPVAKVALEDLPHAPNIHYPGQQKYEDLPRILKGADVCLMPFARNEATQFISPTKTLEYMATHRPIISTPIKDVVRFYSEIVYLADSPDSFKSRIEEALQESPEERKRRNLLEDKVLAAQSWDAISNRMLTLMHRTAVPESVATLRRQSTPRASLTRVVVSAPSSSSQGTPAISVPAVISAQAGKATVEVPSMGVNAAAASTSYAAKRSGR